MVMLQFLIFLAEMKSWEESVEDLCEDFKCTSAQGKPLPTDLHDTSTTVNQGSTIVLWLLHFVKALQRKHSMPSVVLNAILKFLRAIFTVLSPCSEVIAMIARKCSSSLYGAHKRLGIQRDDFVKYMVCPDTLCCTLIHHVVHYICTVKPLSQEGASKFLRDVVDLKEEVPVGSHFYEQ